MIEKLKVLSEYQQQLNSLKQQYAISERDMIVLLFKEHITYLLLSEYDIKLNDMGNVIGVKCISDYRVEVELSIEFESIILTITRLGKIVNKEVLSNEYDEFKVEFENAIANLSEN